MKDHWKTRIPQHITPRHRPFKGIGWVGECLAAIVVAVIVINLVLLVMPVAN